MLKIKTIAGIGDFYNDIPMFDAVDYAFTFEHSPQIIQEQCDYVVKRVAEAVQILEKGSKYEDISATKIEDRW